VTSAGFGAYNRYRRVDNNKVTKQSRQQDSGVFGWV